MRIAIIQKEVVTNIAEFKTLSVAQACLGSTSIPIPVDDLPVAIGDRYTDGIFYRDGQQVEPLPGPEQQLAQLQEKLLDTQVAMAELSILQSLTMQQHNAPAEPDTTVSGGEANV